MRFHQSLKFNSLLGPSTIKVNMLSADAVRNVRGEKSPISAHRCSGTPRPL